MPQTQTVMSLTILKPENLELVLLKKGVFPVHAGARLTDFKKLPPARPAFISGPVGCGKTHLAVAYLADAVLLAMAQPNEQHQADRAVGRIGFTRAVDLMMGLRSSFKNGEPGPGGIMEIYCSFRFLVIDDLGTERDTPLVQEALYSILDYRAGHRLATLITSNLSLQRIAGQYGDYGERLASRIAGMGRELELKGKDQRWQK